MKLNAIAWKVMRKSETYHKSHWNFFIFLSFLNIPSANSVLDKMTKYVAIKEDWAKGYFLIELYKILVEQHFIHEISLNLRFDFSEMKMEYTALLSLVDSRSSFLNSKFSIWKTIYLCRNISIWYRSNWEQWSNEAYRITCETPLF